MVRPRRLLLAMILLVVATSCLASAVTYVLVTQVPSGGWLVTVVVVALAGLFSAGALMFGGESLPGGTWRKPLLEPPDEPAVRNQAAPSSGSRPLIDGDMAQAII